MNAIGWTLGMRVNFPPQGLSLVLARFERPAPFSTFYAWDVYRAAARARWVGRVIAANVGEAIEAAAVEFRTDIKKPVAVRRYEIA